MADEDLVRIKQKQRLSDQHMDNYSFDTEFDISARLLVGYHVSTDSIKRITVDELGKILVSLAGNESVWEYDDATSVAANALTTILTYTVTGTEKLFLDSVFASGEIDAEYSIVVDGNIKAKYKTSEQDRTAKFLFPCSQKFSVGTIIDIKVIHFNTAVSGDFNASLIGHK